MSSLSLNNNNHGLEQFCRHILLNDVNAILSHDTAQYQKVYVDTLIDVTTLTIRSTWPLEMTVSKNGQQVVDTSLFVRHLLKRSRATRSTLQLAIFYLFRIRPHIAQRCQFDPIVKCGRRMFLAALISAHKYLYDNTFTNKSWAKISKLPVQEVNAAERSLLEILDYRLYVATELYEKFESQLKEAMPPQPQPVNMNNKRTISPVNSPISKKQKHIHTITNIQHGIPTPEDDKIEF